MIYFFHEIGHLELSLIRSSCGLVISKKQNIKRKLPENHTEAVMTKIFALKIERMGCRCLKDNKGIYEHSLKRLGNNYTGKEKFKTIFKFFESI